MMVMVVIVKSGSNDASGDQDWVGIGVLFLAVVGEERWKVREE